MVPPQPDGTTIEMNGRRVVITRDDADALARDLARSIRQSPLGEDERQMLLARSSPHGFIDAEGTVRIGAWVLMERGEGWELLHRFLPPDPRQYIAFGAKVSGTAGGLSVGEVTRVIFHPPRRREP